MNWNLFRTSVCLTFICLCIGCGSEYPTVSGKVTYEGKPLSNVRLLFNPVSESAAPGPWSSGVTDEAGAFSLETRYGATGAVVGPHKVGIGWSDIRSNTLQELERSLSESKDMPEKSARLKAEIADVKQKLATRPTLAADLQTTFTVPENGTSEATFELTDF